MNENQKKLADSLRRVIDGEYAEIERCREQIKTLERVIESRQSSINEYTKELTELEVRAELTST